MYRKHVMARFKRAVQDLKRGGWARVILITSRVAVVKFSNNFDGGYRLVNQYIYNTGSALSIS
jgi:hypothetical protein